MTTAPESSPDVLGDICSLYIDLSPAAPAIEPGDWITTRAGSRYLVGGRAVRTGHRRPRSGVRWQLSVHRLPRHCEVPADVRAIELRWYRR